MSWLNFNDSLNNLKGQITNFASNVLADEEGLEVKREDYEELKKICVQQNIEITNLKKVNEDLQEKYFQVQQNGVADSNLITQKNWDWDAGDQENSISDLKNRIVDLEAEKNDLIGQIEQLDLENQQNLAKIVQVKENLQKENNDLKENFVRLKKDDGCKEKYETLLQDTQMLKAELEGLKKEYSVLESSNTTLQKVLDDYKTVSAEEAGRIKQLEGENKIINVDLQKAKDSVRHYQKKTSDDAETCQRLELILENYEKQVSGLKKELEDARGVVVGQEELDSLRTKLDDLKSVNRDLRVANDKLQEEISTFENEFAKLKKELEDVQKNHENVLLKLHDKYVNIITENVRKFQDCDKPSDFPRCSNAEDPQMEEFSKQVENILRILFDFKCKCEVLENKVYDMSEEKTSLLTEKNHEIEKLIQNSEILSQEVITKTQAIKDYEQECNELSKNNDLLINELENTKNSSGLQTISESNEDSMVLLEMQLENANKRIEDLERIIDDLEKQQKENSDLEPQNQLDDAMQHLIITETEITNKKKDYQELLNSFDQLQIEYDTLKFDLKVATEENEELKYSLDKVKADYENAEYQLNEIIVTAEKTDAIEMKNDKLQMLNEEGNKIHEELRIELNAVQGRLLEEGERTKEFEIQIRHLTEKLQNAKMTETSLKLQYDTVSKEVLALSEAKRTFEVAVNKSNADFQSNFNDIQRQKENLKEEYEELRKVAERRSEQIKNFEELVGNLQNRLQKFEDLAVDENAQIFEKLSIHGDENPSGGRMEVDVKETEKESEVQFKAIVEERNNLQMELSRLGQIQIDFKESLAKRDVLEQELQKVSNSRNELINLVTTKHQESIVYHNEIQRLSQYLALQTEKGKNLEVQLNQLQNTEGIESKNQEIEKLTDQNNFLTEKCGIMAENLLEEQSKVQKMLAERAKPSERELGLQKNIDRLQAHLIELEERYTQELLQAEQKNSVLQTKVTEIEEREKSSSNMYTSVSIRANQQVESLQNQLQAVVNERDALRNQISDAEDLNSKQAAALANLQFVLEQFGKDKEKDVQKETERIRRQITTEKQIQDELKKEISSLTSQLEEAKQGLQAASRLSDQLEYSKKLIGTLKEDVSQLHEKLEKSEKELRNATSQTDGKVDKSLIKNLIIGFVSSNNNMNKDQVQILKIIATVLGFNQQEHDKVNLNKPQQGSWLGSFLTPHPSNQNMSQESLSQAFIKFLENESKPRTVPSLLNATPATSTNSSKSTTPRQSPIVLSEIVLPTFADFSQNRNSSSILKDVLKDNS